jgi:hypothetical protein
MSSSFRYLGENLTAHIRQGRGARSIDIDNNIDNNHTIDSALGCVPAIAVYCHSEVDAAARAGIVKGLIPTTLFMRPCWQLLKNL